LRRELEWLKKGPKARSTKQKARIDRIKDMRAEEFKTANGKVEIATAGRRIGKKVIELVNICKAYGDRILIKDFTYNFTPEDRIGIIGCNGAGKSTLMDIVTGRIKPDSGTVEIGTTIHIGYFDQHSEDLTPNEDQRVIEYLKSVGELVKTADGEIITASQMLEKFLFPPNQQYAPISKLSGGEKRRLFLLKVLMSAPNVLILDEPTNDLDVQTLTVLEDYLEDFNGCVIVVSHDRYFLDRTIDMVFALEPGGNLRLYPGNYSVYVDYKKAEEAKELKAQKSKGKLSQSATPPNPPLSMGGENQQLSPLAKGGENQKLDKPRKLSFNEKREYEKLEVKIPQMEAEKAEIEQILSLNSPSGFSQVKKLSERLGQLNQEIDRATELWLEFAERVS